MRRVLGIWTLLIFAAIAMTTVTAAQAAVTVTSFVGYVDMSGPSIVLYWETATELDFAGFRIERSLTENNGFAPLLDENGDPLWFQAIADPGSGTQYSYVDEDVEIGLWYFYRLELIDLGGGTSYYEEIVALYMGNTPTPTATATATATSTSDTRTPTGTRTPVPPTSTRTKTRQPTATNTRTPSPFHAVTYTSRPRATSTLTDTPTATPTQTISPTATTTLMPLPSLTLLFPARTATPTFTPSPTITSSPIPPSSTPTPELEHHIPLRVSFLWGIIVLLWLTLAGFLVAYLRRVSR